MYGVSFRALPISISFLLRLIKDYHMNPLRPLSLENQHNYESSSSFFQIDCVADDELTARVNMGDAKFTFQERGKAFHPQWMAPEALLKSPKQMNTRAADMWSFAVLLWELTTREVPFGDLSPMEVGMKVGRKDCNDSSMDSLNSTEEVMSIVG